MRCHTIGHQGFLDMPLQFIQPFFADHGLSSGMRARMCLPRTTSSP
jgi:hypothetical protein